MATPTAIAGYLTLFVAIGALFLLVNLLVGKLVRPSDPHPDKLDIYECGEPTIGSSFVQFDLRFYVVALVFIVFDAEMAFLFPVATVFGKQTQLADPDLVLTQPVAKSTGDGSAAGTAVITPEAAGLFREMGVQPPANLNDADLRKAMDQFTWYVYGATLVFFFVLFVGFAYEWKTGAFDWVRAVSRPQTPRAGPAPTSETTGQADPALLRA